MSSSPDGCPVFWFTGLSGAAIRDFADKAAVVSLLDLVIAVDTSVAHLAGALGKPVWIMLPFNPDFVLGAALAQVGRWRDDGLTLTVAINFPPQLLTDLTFPDRLADQLREYGVDASQVILEITESGAMADTANTMDILTRLRLKGVKLSMDDFGTGYSSLVELYRMPFSELKIDKSFVMNVTEDHEAEAIVRSVVALGHNLGLEVCAEGVESKAAMDLLRAIHCDKAQGYYISEPKPVEEMTQWLRACAPEPILPGLGVGAP